MRRVVWTQSARADIERITDYLKSVSPKGATRISVQLVAAANSLADFPERGRAIGPRRELTVIPPYVIRYRVDADRVLILRVRHGARRP